MSAPNVSASPPPNARALTPSSTQHLNHAPASPSRHWLLPISQANTPRGAALAARPLQRGVGRVEKPAPTWMDTPMHGLSLTAETRCTAVLRTLALMCDGRLFGRHLPDAA